MSINNYAYAEGYLEAGIQGQIDVLKISLEYPNSLTTNVQRVITDLEQMLETAKKYCKADYDVMDDLHQKAMELEGQCKKLGY